ncbi:UMP kinase [Candidatus Micrarchaeota archaeon]|nr:UMP kinase [Candidatus Micrarchaeota archaeon]
MSASSKPIVISLGGSLLFNENGIDTKVVKSACELFLKLKKEGKKLVVIVGGGKTARDYTNAVRELTGNEFFADRLAIDGTRMNALLLISVLGDEAYPKVVTDFDETFYALKQGLLPVGAGMLEGITTDTDAILIAERLGATHLINASNVDGIYSADPRKDPKAKKFEEITHQKLIELATIGDARKARTNFVFDLVASKLAARSNVELHFVPGRNLDELEKAIKGQKHSGTIVKD